MNKEAIPSVAEIATQSQAVVGQRKFQRVIQLDFLRGVAILLVLGTHSYGILRPEEAGIFQPLSAFLARFGWTGVNLFFVLSGFLVGGLLLRELQKYGTLQVKRFIIRRGLKIWPSYYILLGWLLFQGFRAHHSWHAAIEPLLPNFLHIQNYVYMKQEFTWSLAVEEHFYLLLPILLWFLTRRRKRSLLHLFPIVFLIIAVVSFALRCLILLQHPYIVPAPLTYYWTVSMPTQFNIDALMFGVFLAYLTHFRPDTLKFAESSQKRWILFALGILLISPMILFDKTDPRYMALLSTLGLTLLYLGYGCVLIACTQSMTSDGSPGRLFQTKLAKLIALIGFYSYPIYLWHMSQGRDRLVHLLYIGKFAHMSASLRWLVAISLYMVFAIGFGIVFSRLLELPVLALRERFFPDRTRP